MEVRLQGSLAPFPMKEGKYVKLSIKDQGVGIAEDNLERVFDPYFSTKERGSQKGMGLGLTVAYSIFKKRGGHVSLESERGVGTVLHLYIPVSDQPRNQNKGTMGMLRAESQMRRQVL